MGKQLKTPKQKTPNPPASKLKSQPQQYAEIDNEPLSSQKQQQQDQKSAPKISNPLHSFSPKKPLLSQKSHIKKLSKAIKSIALQKTQIQHSIECLQQFSSHNSNPVDLAGGKDFLYLEVVVSRIPEWHSVRPIQIKLPYPIYGVDRKSRISIITSNQGQDEFLEIVDKADMPMLKEVISYKKIQKEYRQIGDKRELLAANDLLFCDWKIYNLLRQPLGKLFYDQKKYPYPISCSGQVPANLTQQYPTYQSYLAGLTDYTYTMLGNGPVYGLKIGRLDMPVRELVKNVMHGAYSFIANILDSSTKPEHVRQICVKTYNSPSLPIYSHLTKEEIQGYQKGTQ